MTENILESLRLLVVGLLGVFAALLLLAAMIWAFRAVDEGLNKRRIRKYSAQVESKQVDTDLNDEIVAVIAAAATATLKKPIIVRRVRFLHAHPVGAWAVTGRLNVMASHSIAKRKS
jgi:sodium pump decarboxylase gamma subunit